MDPRRYIQTDILTGIADDVVQVQYGSLLGLKGRWDPLK